MRLSAVHAQNTSTIVILQCVTLAIVIGISVVFCSGSFSVGNSEDVSEYVIGPEDVLQVSVWQHDQFNTTAPVGPDGKITVPLSGDISVAGLTREEARRDIAEMLTKFIKDESIEVTVSIVQFNSQKIFVFGPGIQNSGVITFSSVPSFLEVMSQYVTTPDADLAAVKIIPADSSIRKPITVNMAEVLEKGDTSQLPKLSSGDTVYVPRIRTEVGETGTEGVAEDQPQVIGDQGTATSPPPPDVEEGAGQFVVYVMGAATGPVPVVSGEGITIIQALSQSGSVTDDMALKDVRVIRAKPTDGDRVIHVDLDRYLAEGDISLIPRLYPGDTIYVPSIASGGAKDISITITGEVLSPGTYQTREPMDILDAISMAGGLTPNADPERIRVRRESADSYQEKVVNIDEFLEDVGSTSPTEMVGPGYRIYVPTKRGSTIRVAVAARGVVTFLADLIPIYGLYRLVRE